MIFKNPLIQIKMKTQIDKLIRHREHGANKELKEVTHAICITQIMKQNYIISTRNDTHCRMDKQYIRQKNISSCINIVIQTHLAIKGIGIKYSCLSQLEDTSEILWQIKGVRHEKL